VENVDDAESRITESVDSDDTGKGKDQSWGNLGRQELRVRTRTRAGARTPTGDKHG